MTSSIMKIRRNGKNKLNYHYSTSAVFDNYTIALITAVEFLSLKLKCGTDLLGVNVWKMQ
jgi:hypothetical protein